MLEEGRPVMENVRRRWLLGWLLEGVEGSVARARRWGGAFPPKREEAKAQVWGAAHRSRPCLQRGGVT